MNRGARPLPAVNFLGHLYLSPPDDDSLLGSLMGDFVKGPLDGSHGAAITRAIDLHRKIDVFTDAHPAFLSSKSRVSTMRRRYAGIMIDLFYDHFLARHWRDFHDEPLGEFTFRVYRLLSARREELPPAMRETAQRMAQLDWLGSYANVAAVHTALDRMSRRLRRENPLPGAAAELEENYQGFEADFREFLPSARQFARAAGRRAGMY